MSKTLVRARYNVTVIDNISTGHLSLAKYGRLIKADLRDKPLINSIVASGNFDSVIHFAGSSIVGESVTDPAVYFDNNTAVTIGLLNILVRNGVKNFVFSSSAAIYGEPKYTPIDESHQQCPTNPYGLSKLMVEMVLRDYHKSYGLNSVVLRYFNACGADPELELGELHEPESHLIPLVLQAASGRRDSIKIFGNDYPTVDGTCVRDYIHVYDICSAHLLAMKSMYKCQNLGVNFYNLGNGVGFSVKEVIETAKSVVRQDNCTIKVSEETRRLGDPAILVADSTKIRKELGWSPRYPDLYEIISHAWEWEKKYLKSDGADD